MLYSLSLGLISFLLSAGSNQSVSTNQHKLCVLAAMDDWQQVSAIAPAPVAAFQVPDSLFDCAEVLVPFQNLSSGDSLEYTWLFPGGAPATSSARDPEVVYTASGRYPVTLIVSNAEGTDTLTENIDILVLGYPQAAFAYELPGNNSVQFRNQSVHALNYTWYFGDGSPTSNDVEPIHQYSGNGPFTVTLIADNFCGTSVLQKPVSLVVNTSNANKLSGVQLHVYPNPAKDQLFVDYSGWAQAPQQLRLLTAQGQLLEVRSNLADQPVVLDCSSLPEGVYYVQLRFADYFIVEPVLKL